MERLTSYKSECKREMICVYEDCDTSEEHCPHINEDTCPCLQKAIDKLAEYEDLEEQGKLLKLPCNVGDTVYIVRKNYGDIIKGEIFSFSLGRLGRILKIFIKEDNRHTEMNFSDFDKTVFLNKDQAEKALEEMKRM